MTMSTIFRPSSFPWMLNLATRMLARLLNMPEPLLRSTGVFVFVHVQAVETSVGKKLCPIRLLRQFLTSRHQAGASIPQPSTPTREGELP
jgi:hypothetical protein